jgi:hypothetical protein
MNGYVKRRNCRICIEKRLREIYEHVRNFQKVNLFCSIMQENVIRPFVFTKKNVINANICMDVLQILISL